MDPDDSALIDDVLRGNKESYDLLVQRHISGLFRHIDILVKNTALAEDLTQDTFIKAYDKLSTFDPQKAQFKTWLFTIATRKALDTFKKKTTIDIDEVVIVSKLASPPQKAKEQEVRDAVNELEPNQRSVVSLYYWQSYSYEQISTIMDVPQGSVKGWMYRAKKVLKERLS